MYLFESWPMVIHTVFDHREGMGVLVLLCSWVRLTGHCRGVVDKSKWWCHSEHTRNKRGCLAAYLAAAPSEKVSASCPSKQVKRISLLPCLLHFILPFLQSVLVVNKYSLSVEGGCCICLFVGSNHQDGRSSVLFYILLRRHWNCAEQG